MNRCRANDFLLVKRLKNVCWVVSNNVHLTQSVSSRSKLTLICLAVIRRASIVMLDQWESVTAYFSSERSLLSSSQQDYCSLSPPPQHYFSSMVVTGYVFSIQYILRSRCGELLKQDFFDEILRYCFHPILRFKFERLTDTFPQTGFSYLSFMLAFYIK